MAKFGKKINARLLRRRGMMLTEIAQKLSVSKSTISLWCRDIQLSVSVLRQMEKRTRNKHILAQRSGAESNKRLRLLRVEDAETWARNQILRCSTRDVLLAGIGLYWGEGSKGRKLNFSNSDPKLLSFIKQWFEVCLDVKSQDFLVRVSINESHRDRYEKVQRHWQHILRLPSRQFYRPTFLKTRQKKVYENRETYYGVLSLRVRNSTNLQYRILGLIKAMVPAGVAQVVRAAHS